VDRVELRQRFERNGRRFEIGSRRQEKRAQHEESPGLHEISRTASARLRRRPTRRTGGWRRRGSAPSA
jgi:hypothetical protein